jgi:hypothetical protein
MRACLSPEQRQRIIDLRDENPKLRYKTLAVRFGCSIAYVASIISGRSGKAAPKPKAPRLMPNVMPGITMAQLTARR